ncbi:hypothetical protein RHMOL_Rhmol10G0072700 [Rhododendron molle]|uniref:Uncharacterized protein n=1 Tax=Rhododendron molle TaxID=49168 RepID=A0ACC0M027_RHOML|nr:hypothetical protein RHMOL_Rhmol10G0072700 [Rhododendron molle]
MNANKEKEEEEVTLFWFRPLTSQWSKRASSDLASPSPPTCRSSTPSICDPSYICARNRILNKTWSSSKPTKFSSSNSELMVLRYLCTEPYPRENLKFLQTHKIQLFQFEIDGSAKWKQTEQNGISRTRTGHRQNDLRASSSTSSTAPSPTLASPSLYVPSISPPLLLMPQPARRQGQREPLVAGRVRMVTERSLETSKRMAVMGEVGGDEGGAAGGQ